MSINLVTLRSELREHLGVDEDDPGWLDEDCDLVLNRTFWEILDKFPFREKEASTTISTVAGTRDYTMPTSYDSLRELGITDTDSQFTQLDRITEKVYLDLYNSTSTLQALPTKYYRYNDFYRVYPTPDQVYTITVLYLINLADLSNSNNTPVIPQSWHEIILFGSVWRGLKRNGDDNRAKTWKTDYYGLIADMSPVQSEEERDSSLAGIEMPGRDY